MDYNTEMKEGYRKSTWRGDGDGNNAIIACIPLYERGDTTVYPSAPVSGSGGGSQNRKHNT